MKDHRFLRAYAALRSGVMKSNVIEEYLPFFASIIIESGMNPIDDKKLADLFAKKYGVEISIQFVRQVLSLAVSKGCIADDKGRFCPKVDCLNIYCIDESVYQNQMQSLLTELFAFCGRQGLYCDANMDEAAVLEIIEQYGHNIDRSLNKNESNGYIYSWFSYIKYLSEERESLYNFVAALSVSSAIKDALFFSDIAGADYSDLNVYLDSPMIFALLGLDTPERQDAYKYLIDQIHQARCSIYIFRHNYQEFVGILENAANWAISADYDMSKASRAARFFHDSQIDEQEITEYIGNVETELNNINITVIDTTYNMIEDHFQEDENKLFEMIHQKYIDNGRLLQSEIEQSIRIDVKSIIMIYRSRGGNVSTTIPQCRHIMLTTNNLIANVSKNYESNQSLNSGHIPACISADFFGAILWLNSPVKMLSYQRKQLLADCYLFRQPTRKMIEDYVKTLEKAHDSGEIDDKKFIFLRSHPMVRDALMNITKGDYAKFSNDTWKEVFEDIQEKAEKKYRDEESAHHYTKRLLEDTQVKFREMQQEKKSLEKRVQDLEEERLKEKETQFTNKCNNLGLVFSCLIFGTPYIAILAVIELIKAQYSVFSWNSLFVTAGLLIVPLILAFIFTKCRKWCSQKVRAYYLKKQSKSTTVS